MSRKTEISTACLKAIMDLKQEDQKNIKNSWDINNGSCYDFADRVCKIIKKSESPHDLFYIDNDLIEKYYFNELLVNPPEKVCAVLDKIISSVQDSLDSYKKSLHIADFIIELQPHVWLCDLNTGLFFDAELPFGTQQITELPYISRNIWGNVIDNSDYYADKPIEVRDHLIKFVSQMLLDDVDNHHKLMSITELVNDCNYLCRDLKTDTKTIVSESIKNADKKHNEFTYFNP